MPTTSPTRRPPGWRPVAAHTRQLLRLILGLVVLLAACSSQEPASEENPDPSQPPEEPVTIRMGFFVPGHELFYVMQHMPEVAPNLGTWYDVEWAQMGGAQLAQGVAANTLDGASIAALGAATLIEQDVDLVLTGQFVGEREPNTPVTWLVRTDSGITSPAGLEGETIGTLAIGQYTDQVGDYQIRTESGLEAGEDYQKVELALPLMQDALLSGQIVTGPFAPPFLQQALATGEVQPLFDVLDVQDEWVVSVQAFQRDFVDEHRVAVEKFMEDWVTVFQWIADPANRAAVIESTSESTKIPVEVLERFLLTEEDGYRPPNGALNREVLQSNWDFFREQGVLSTDVKVEDHIIEELMPPAS